MAVSDILKAINLFNDEINMNQLLLDVTRPIGSTYTQYPGQEEPGGVVSIDPNTQEESVTYGLFNKEDGSIVSRWEELNYNGSFFRASGTDALTNKSVPVSSISSLDPTTLTIVNHGAVAKQMIYAPEVNETRTVSSVTSTNVLKIDSAFSQTESGQNITKVIILQREGIPDITGTFAADGDWQWDSSTWYVRGCFSQTSTTRKRPDGYRGDTWTYPMLQFNASKGEVKMGGSRRNDVYGFSNYVTPRNGTIIIWKRIG